MHKLLRSKCVNEHLLRSQRKLCAWLMGKILLQRFNTRWQHSKCVNNDSLLPLCTVFCNSVRRFPRLRYNSALFSLFSLIYLLFFHTWHICLSSFQLVAASKSEKKIVKIMLRHLLSFVELSSVASPLHSSSLITRCCLRLPGTSSFWRRR